MPWFRTRSGSPRERLSWRRKKDFIKLRDELSRQRRELPWEVRFLTNLPGRRISLASKSTAGQRSFAIEPFPAADVAEQNEIPQTIIRQVPDHRAGFRFVKKSFPNVVFGQFADVRRPCKMPASNRRSATSY
jgi:hypothetical protein